MAASTCFYHADQVASTTCAQCAVPLCGQCTQTVAGKSVCRRCVDAIRARVASEMSSSAPAAPASSFPQPGAYSPPNSYVPAQSARAAAPAGLSTTGLLLGAVYGALIGIVGAFALGKIEFYSNFQIGYLNALVGYGCGFGVLLGCKRGGVVPAVLGGVLAFFAMMLSEYVFFQAAVAQFISQNPGSAGPLSQYTFMDHLGHIGLTWLFIAIGVYGGAKTPLRAAR